MSDKLIDLNKSLDKALVGIPALSHDAQITLQHINSLTIELKTLSTELRGLSIKTGHLADKAGDFADTGKNMGTQLMQTTVPRMNALLIDLQSTSRRIKSATIQLENNPQSLLLGPKPLKPGPGEPDFKEVK